MRKILIIIFSLVLLFGAYRYAKSKGWLSNNIFSQIEDVVPNKITLPWQKDKELQIDQINFNQEDLDKLGQDGLSQIKILTEKAKDAGGVAQDFVQEAITVDENKDKNISEKAFEYGKYIYCQEVVKQYEASSSSSKTF
jgi:hypothetical protein